jgi:GTPase SAR1 family protein
MAAGECNKTGCTVGTTGICLLLNQDPTSCENFVQAPAVSTSNSQSEAQLAPIGLPRADAVRKFPAGFELGTQDAYEIMWARYTHLIAILGEWNAGKTSFLLSLYLMASRGNLPRSLAFAGSETLPGFEARARHIRRWSGGPVPDQIADHTSLSDPRQPAFLHLSMAERADGSNKTDLLLTDLPGEWTESLVNKASSAARMQFLRRADGIIVVLDAPHLAGDGRHAESQKAQLLLDRLSSTVMIAADIPLVLLISKSDLVDFQRASAVDDIEQHAKDLGFSPKTIQCAAFSSKPHSFSNGLGVFETVDAIVSAAVARSPRMRNDGVPHNRAFLRF